MEKSTKLAELMGWELETISNEVIIISKYNDILSDIELCPYDNCQIGLAQFSTILLKFPDVIERFVNTSGHTPEYATTKERYERYGRQYQGYIDREFTQETVLDEILRMNNLL